MPEPVRKARQARPLSPPQASRPSGLTNTSIRLVFRSPSIRCARDRYAGTSRHGARGHPGACVGRGTADLARSAGKASAQRIYPTFTGQAITRALTSRCRTLPRSTGVALWGRMCVRRSARYHSTRLLTTEHEAAAFFLPTRPPQEEQLETGHGCLHRGRRTRNSYFGIA